MAKPIVVSLNGSESRFDFSKLGRDKLFGKKRRLAVDSRGDTCDAVSLDLDTGLIVASGMSAQGYFDGSGVWIPNNELVGLDANLQAIEAVPSTLGVCQELRGPIKPQEVFDLRVDAVYVLEPQSMDDALEAALDTGEVYAFAFNYRGDFQSEQGVLVKNDKGYFALVGQPTVPVWSEFDAPPPPVFEAEEEDDSDDLDFEMF